MGKNYAMEIIPKPKEGTAAVLMMDKEGEYPLLRGHSEDNYLCGVCGNIICENVTRQQIISFVLACPNCQSYNRIKGT